MADQLTPKEVLGFYEKAGLPESFCPVPFSSLIFESNGNVCLCRRKGSEFAIGDIRRESFADIWNGERLKAIRREFLEGTPRACAEEIGRDRCNLAADNADLLPFIDFSVTQKRPPLRISPNFNGRCNLECKMCHIWRHPSGLYDEIGFWSSFEKEILPHLKEIDAYSGEPFVQKDTYRLINLVSNRNPDVTWSFTTNANWRLNGHVRGHLDKIRIKTFNISIDSLDPLTYSDIRKKGQLKKAIENLDLLQRYEETRLASGRSGLGLVLHSLVMRDNWKEIPALLRFRRERKIKIHLKCLFEPPELSIAGLSAGEKKEILWHLLDSLGGNDLMTTAVLFKVLLPALAPVERAAVMSEYQRKVISPEGALSSS